MNTNNKTRAFLMAVCVSGASASLPVMAQYCPVATTYFSSNYSLPSCAVGTCWSATAFTGSTSVSGSYPSTNYKCATTSPGSGALENTLTTYDSNGNATAVKDPLAHQTSNVFDALNRLTQVTDPGSGVTGYTYDPAGNLTQVTDPRSLGASYGYDGLNNLVQQVSPDTGTTTNTYDAAGNVSTKVDARGVTATYTYDALNRATQIVYSKTSTTSETHSLEYDGGIGGAANAKGHLTKATDPAGTTTWAYNSQGRVASKTQTIGTVTQTVSYTYNSAGQLTQITMPSGQAIGYSYSNNRIVSITINGSTLLSGAYTTPFGPVGAWNWANGLYTFRTYDLDGRLSSWEFRNGVSVIRKDQTFDYASRITAINDPNNSATNQSYTYDVLDRLTQGQTASPATHTQQFTYDAIGNRQTAVLDSTSTSYGYVSGSNRLSSLSGGTSRSYTYDAVGNPTTVGALTYIYNNANRLVQVKNGSTVIASYEVNALGQRTRKTVGATITRFIYDEKGHLIGEYDDSGNLIQETVWLDELPVATLRPTGSSGTPTPINTYYVHADHLGSPRAVTRPSDNAFTWKWDQLDPFGANVADENPASLGSFMHALRFPGQYYDAETGTNYNYKRDYDAAIGRYLQSDPIGLDGGVNTYAYAKQNPLHFTDPSGQFAVIAPILECLLNPVCAGGVFAIIGVGSQIGSQSGANSGSSSNCPPDDPCDKKLSKHEIEKLQKGGVDVEGEKEGYGGPPSHFDLYKCKNGDIVVKRKGGGEIVARTGLNMNNF